MKKLRIEDLAVSSFETESAAAALPYDQIRITTTTNDPTAATFCYICPAETQNSCWICTENPY